MNRTVPRATSDEIQLYRSTLYSLLRSTAEIKLKTLEGVHSGMNSLMHPGVKDDSPDISAFIYSIMRLPDCIPQVNTVILGQNSAVFKKSGFPDLEEWPQVSAGARRRRCFFDRKSTLACFIPSRSDIEDLVPTLTAYQLEWNKIHTLLMRWPDDLELERAGEDPAIFAVLAETCRISPDDLQKLKTVWREKFTDNFCRMRRKEISISLRLLSSSQSQYIKATHQWFDNIRNAVPALLERPVYFVSSNTHSLLNLLTGFTQRYEDELLDFVRRSTDTDLVLELENIENGQVRSSRENFLYYVMKKYQATPAGARLVALQAEAERELGIVRIQSETTFEVECQVIDPSRLKPDGFDSRLRWHADTWPRPDNGALILNIDYPLGLAAYNILSTVSVHTELRGAYSMGKAASLNARIGDVIIPNVCQDEHSHNTYFVRNAFRAGDVSPYLKFGTVLDNQKAITVLGTFLQNAHIMEIFYSEGFADVEMEFGNFCSALYEASRPKRFPVDEIVNLQDVEIDFGVLHYISDTPMSKGKNLGAGTLSYFGMDSTYACSIAILNRILDLERQRTSAPAG